MLSLSSPINGAAKGTLAGIAGTAVIQLVSLGKQDDTVYQPERLAGRLASRYLHRCLSPSERRTAGSVLRWLYGPGWGTAFGEVQEVVHVPYPIAGVALGAAVWVFELLALPLTAATPRLKSWGKGQIAMDGIQAILFGVATASALTLLE